MVSQSRNIEVFKISVLTIIKEIKSIHQKDIAMVKMGNFYHMYGKDAYIIAYLFQYKIKKENDMVTTGFPVQAINKVKANLENKKINYIVLDRKDNYSIDETMDFKNLNTYDKQYASSKIYINNKIRINNINDYLIKNASKEDLNILLKEIEEVINARRKI